MGDSAAVTISEAARLTGKGRQTIYRHIKRGKLSTTIRGDGTKEIQVIDLERLYGSLGGLVRIMRRPVPLPIVKQRYSVRMKL